MAKFSNRESTYPIQEFFLSRVSSRAFSEERLTEEELMSLFEAALWAPSSYNNQPWRFIYARRGDRAWDMFFDALIDFNKSWCNRADTLVVVISKNNFEHNNKFSRTSQFDTGAAWMSLALEAHSKGIVAHGMEGFNYAKIQEGLNVPDSFTILAMVALGKQGSTQSLPSDLQGKEVPSTRKPLLNIVSREKFIF
jgi:nitroreductase